MELHTPYRMLAMFDCVDLVWVIARARNDLQVFRQRLPLYHERVVAHHGQWVTHAREYPLPVMGDSRRLAVHQCLGTDNLAAICFADRLMAKTHPKDRNLPAPLPDRRHADTSLP